MAARPAGAEEVSYRQVGIAERGRKGGNAN